MYAAHVMDVPGDHARAVAGHDPTQRRHRQRCAMLRDQAADRELATPITAVAGYRQHGELGGHLTEQRDARTGCRGRWAFHAATLGHAVVSVHPAGRTKKAPRLVGRGEFTGVTSAAPRPR